MMTYAVADTGSNTIRLAIYTYENGKLNQIYNEAVFANLAGYITDNTLTAEGIDRAVDAILKHKKTTEQYGCDLHVFATAAIRNAKNAEEICDAIKTRTGITVDLISGAEEALLSFRGARCDFPVEQGVMTDVGGGSSEVIWFEGEEAKAFRSVPWGGLKAFKDFVTEGLPDEAQMRTIIRRITEVLEQEKAFQAIKTENLCVVGGSVRAAKKLAEAILGETKITLSVVDRLLAYIISEPILSRAVICKTAPKRADTIAPALCIYAAIGHYFGAEKVYFSDNGIKEGYVLQKLI